MVFVWCEDSEVGRAKYRSISIRTSKIMGGQNHEDEHQYPSFMILPSHDFASLVGPLSGSRNSSNPVFVARWCELFPSSFNFRDMALSSQVLWTRRKQSWPYVADNDLRPNSLVSLLWIIIAEVSSAVGESTR